MGIPKKVDSDDNEGINLLVKAKEGRQEERASLFHALYRSFQKKTWHKLKDME